MAESNFTRLPGYILDRDNRIAQFGIQVEHEIHKASGEVVTRWYGTEDKIRATGYFSSYIRFPVRAGRMFARFGVSHPECKKHRNGYLLSHLDRLPKMLRSQGEVEVYSFEGVGGTPESAYYGTQHALLEAKLIEPRCVPPSGGKRHHGYKSVMVHDKDKHRNISYETRRIYGLQKLYTHISYGRVSSPQTEEIETQDLFRKRVLAIVDWFRLDLTGDAGFQFSNDAKAQIEQSLAALRNAVASGEILGEKPKYRCDGNVIYLTDAGAKGTI